MNNLNHVCALCGANLIDINIVMPNGVEICDNCAEHIFTGIAARKAAEEADVKSTDTNITSILA